MALDRDAIVDTLRRPEYTGGDRCLPCTLLNGCIAAVVSAGVALLSPIAGAALFGSSVLVIYFRGYLVPGTPAITRRYFPTRLLRLFGKGSPVHEGGPEESLRFREANDGVRDADTEPKATLKRIGILSECPERDDLCLTDGFRRAWRKAIGSLRDDRFGQRRALTAVLDADTTSSSVVISEGEYGTTASVGDTVVGSWPSSAAFVADIAAAETLSKREVDWRELDTPTRGSLLGRLRIFLDTCPACDGRVRLEEESQDACCWSRTVTTLRCSNCDARLLELDELDLDDGPTDYV